MTTTTVEALSLDATPGIQALLQELFNLLDIPFASDTITRSDLFLLFEACKVRVVTIAKKATTEQDTDTAALIVTRMGIITHQIRLMLSQQQIKATCVGYTNEIPKLLKERPYQMMVLDVPYERGIDGGLVSSMPEELAYVLKCQRALNTRLNMIAIMDPYDKRRPIIEKTGVHTIVKEGGWQAQLKETLNDLVSVE